MIVAQGFESLATAGDIEGLVDRDSVEPAEELEAGIEAAETLVCLEKDTLSNILRVVPPAGDAVRDIENRSLVPFNQLFKGRPIPCQALADEIQIIPPCHKYNRRAIKLVERATLRS
jgi:hypothetical protein